MLGLFFLVPVFAVRSVPGSVLQGMRGNALFSCAIRDQVNFHILEETSLDGDLGLNIPFIYIENGYTQYQ